MIIEIAALAYIGGSYVYHRWFEDKEPPPMARELDIPRTQDGAGVPLIFGRCRVKSPVLAWVGSPAAQEVPFSGLYNEGDVVPGFMYGANMFFQVGIPFRGGTSRVHRVYVGDFPLSHVEPGIVAGTEQRCAPEDLVGDGGFERNVRRCYLSTRVSSPGATEGLWLEGEIEFLNGNEDQTLVLGPGAASTLTGELMLDESIPDSFIPGFRRYLGVLLARVADDDVDPDFRDGIVEGFVFGQQPQISPVGFEVSSYPETTLGSPTGLGVECNPVDVLYRIFTATFGGLGVPITRIDHASWAAAAIALSSEGNGYSRSVEDMATADDVVDEILKQIDGILWDDAASGTWKLKLVRNDYDTALVPTLSPANCKIQRYPAGSRSNLTNKIRVTYTDRQQEYRDNSVTAQNQANAVGQYGVVNELVLRYPGVCDENNALDIASRELSARSRPIAKLRASCDRRMVRLEPGQVVAVTWPEWNIEGVLFRVVGIGKGTREDGRVDVDLIQEFYNYHRGVVQGSNPLGAFPPDGVLENP